MEEPDINLLHTIFSSDFHVVSSNEHSSGRTSYVAKNDEGYILYVSYFPKNKGKMNVDIFMKEKKNAERNDDD